MKTNDEILKYLSGMLPEEKRREFELKLQKSDSLKRELEKTSAYLSELKALGSLQADTGYFENLLPALRSRLLPHKKKKSFRLYPGIAYMVPAALVAALFLFKPFGFNPFMRGTSTTSEFTREVSEMNDQTRSEVLGSLLENESSITQADVLPDNTAEAVENTMGEELFKGSDNKSQYLDTDELINSISADEADNVYQDMLHKKIL
ncbi:MAG TPA: hypothetical protein VHO03_03080 [Ignavibacteriales bacterium]|nr:hypothetical protein [Ignavibacteriales bacterium]